MSKANLEFKDGKIIAGLDMNEDGENSISLKLDVNESVQEGLSKLKKGEESKVELEAKKVDVEFGMGGVKVKIDLDQDGEHFLELDLSMSEAFDEISSKFLNK